MSKIFSEYRQALLLCFAYALSFSAVTLVIFVGGLAGSDLTGGSAWATLPISSMILGVVAATIPASMIMKKIGRKSGYIAAAFLSSIASLLACWALLEKSFILFCFATFLIGNNSAFLQQYRFAAAESVTGKNSGIAISILLMGGIFGGFLGPQVGSYFQEYILAADYAGSFLAIGAVNLVAIIFLLMTNLKPFPVEKSSRGEERPLAKIIRQPIFFIALFSAAAGYGIMTLVMTATPLSMKSSGFSVPITAGVIQSHVLAMYLPSIFTGLLIKKFGFYRIIYIGILFNFICVALTLHSDTFFNYWGALIFLGIGWNFMFIGATTLLTKTYRPQEKFKAQAINDFSVFGLQAIASFSAGSLLFFFGWETLNLVPIPFLLVIAIFLMFNRKYFSLGS